MKKFLTNLLDWIYKKKCYFCGNSSESAKMCSKCYEEISYLNAYKKKQILGVEIYCAGNYEDTLLKLIRGVKYHKQKELAYFQAKFMYGYWQKLPIKKYEYTIVPVPLYPIREKARGYNHMALVAEKFAKLTGYKVNTNLISRIKNTKPQYDLNKEQRMENLSKAFKINQKKVTRDKILLIDDICTTGATFESIISELNEAGIKDIACFATATPQLTGDFCIDS